ncbi:MAG: YcnI family protein [Jiangellaceae bacterium]
MIKYSRAVARVGAAAVIAAGLAVTLPLAASAHVTISPSGDAVSGGWSTLTLKVPHHPDAGGTVQVRVELPAEAPFASVTTLAVPGWTAELTTEALPEPVEAGEVTLTEAVTEITWTADDAVAIGPGEYGQFGVSVGPLPESGTYEFPAYQTFTDGTVEAWDMPNGDTEPSNPAPALTVIDGEGDGDAHDPHSAGDDTTPVAAEASTASDPDDSDPLARGLAISGLLIGAAGLGLGAAALWKSRA